MVPVARSAASDARLIALALLMLSGCGGGEPTSPPNGQGKSLTITLGALPSPVPATGTFVVSGSVEGDAALDSVILEYDGQRLMTPSRTFQLTLTAVRVGGREVIATAYSREAAAPVRQVRPHTVSPIEVPELVLEVFSRVDITIPAERQALEQMLPSNPGIKSFIEEKIAILGKPGLASDVILGHRFRHRFVASADGREVPVAVIFIAEPMREEAGRAADMVASALIPLEQIMGERYPYDAIPVWYGFTIGASARAGWLAMEDHTTYVRRRGSAGVAPYEALVAHELAHSYIGNEPLTQFLELYAHNVAAGRSTATELWGWTRQYMPMLETNAGVHAVLDIYRAIGRDAMTRALVRMRQDPPMYGQPLPPAAQQALVDEAPDAVKSLVAAKAARVGA